MGVRYNAEKKKIGMYYSTPMYSFRCKCHLCDGWFEIQTDPKVRADWGIWRASCTQAIIEYSLCSGLWREAEGRGMEP